MMQTVINAHLGGKDAFARLLWQSGGVCWLVRGAGGGGRLVNVQAETGMVGSLFPP